jgi:hypothetical protein
MGRRNWIRHHGLVALTALALVAPTSAMAQFLSLSHEAKAVSTLIKCPSPALQIDAELPPLWSCLLRPREVVKVFINGPAFPMHSERI